MSRDTLECLLVGIILGLFCLALGAAWFGVIA